MNSRRLLLLAKRLRSVPRRRFDMTIWADGFFCRKPQEPKHACKTSACALGWATTIPSFSRDGFCQSPPLYSGGQVLISYKGNNGLVAAMYFFDISIEKATFLFHCEDSKGKSRQFETPKLVAKRIEEFVNSGRKDPR